MLFKFSFQRPFWHYKVNILYLITVFSVFEASTPASSLLTFVLINGCVLRIFFQVNDSLVFPFSTLIFCVYCSKKSCSLEWRYTPFYSQILVLRVLLLPSSDYSPNYTRLNMDALWFLSVNLSTNISCVSHGSLRIHHA